MADIDGRRRWSARTSQRCMGSATSTRSSGSSLRASSRPVQAGRWTWRATGTHLGPLFGIPPTGRAIAASAIHIHHVADGQIIDQWEQLDALGVLRQLGVLPG
jgi:hypothetical protein